MLTTPLNSSSAAPDRSGLAGSSLSKGSKSIGSHDTMGGNFEPLTASLTFAGGGPSHQASCKWRMTSGSWNGQLSTELQALAAAEKRSTALRISNHPKPSSCPVGGAICEVTTGTPGSKARGSPAACVKASVLLIPLRASSASKSSAGPSPLCLKFHANSWTCQSLDSSATSNCTWPPYPVRLTGWREDSSKDGNGLMRSCWPRALAEARASTRNAETVLCAYGSQIISSQNPQAVQCAQQLEDSSGGLSLVELATRNSKAQGSNRLSLSCWSVTSRKSENQSDSLTLCLSDKNRVVTNCISLQNDSPDSYAIFRSHPIFATCKREVSPVLPHIDQLLCEHASLAANQLPALSSSSEPLNPGPVVMTYWSQWGNGMMVNSLIILWYIMYIYIYSISLSLCVWIVIMDHSPIPYM